uniref:Uncharacterized protein n=1 Tax=Arundo donax TaxID=35708 RepID=A0A0A9AB34_ARUDO
MCPSFIRGETIWFSSSFPGAELLL